MTGRSKRIKASLAEIISQGSLESRVKSENKERKIKKVSYHIRQ